MYLKPSKIFVAWKKTIQADFAKKHIHVSLNRYPPSFFVKDRALILYKSV